MRAAIGTSVDLAKAEHGAVLHRLEVQEIRNLHGRGPVEDLAARIVSWVPPDDGRTAENSHIALLTIARGLLEFAVADLDPSLWSSMQITCPGHRYLLHRALEPLWENV